MNFQSQGEKSTVLGRDQSKMHFLVLGDGGGEVLHEKDGGWEGLHEDDGGGGGVALHEEDGGPPLVVGGRRIVVIKTVDQGKDFPSTETKVEQDVDNLSRWYRMRHRRWLGEGCCGQIRR